MLSVSLSNIDYQSSFPVHKTKNRYKLKQWVPVETASFSHKPPFLPSLCFSCASSMPPTLHNPLSPAHVNEQPPSPKPRRKEGRFDKSHTHQSLQKPFSTINPNPPPKLPSSDSYYPSLTHFLHPNLHPLRFRSAAC